MNGNAIDFLAYLQERGLRVRAKDGKLLVSPKEKLLPADADYIRANKDAILAEVKLLGPSPCPGVCPGGTHELCCGCPEVQVEYLMPDGLISTQWCLNGRDVAKATHWRHRDELAWHPVGKEATV